MEKKIINTNNAPAPIGPYSQAVQVSNMLFVSGQIALDTTTGALVLDNIESETKMVMTNLLAILNEAGAEFANVVKTSIFLSDMGLFNRVNEVYSSYFTSNFPARETVAVKELPKSVNVEISMIAAI